MKDIILGSEGMGWRAPHLISGFFEAAYPNIEIVYKNTKECDMIVRNHFFDRKCAMPNGAKYYAGEIEPIWNKQSKPYIYRSGESWQVLESDFHTNYVHIKTTNDDTQAIYLPYITNSHYLTQTVRLYTNKNRGHLLAYCNSHAVSERQYMFNKFVEVSNENMCHAFGGCYGDHVELQRKLPGNYTSEKLIQHYSDYYFVIAMENKIAPGYITEKILNAYASGSIPIYWGDAVVTEFFNKDSFVNLSDFESIDECVDYVVNMKLDKIHWMMSQPVFNENTKYNDIINIHKSKDYYINNLPKIMPLLDEVVETRKLK